MVAGKGYLDTNYWVKCYQQVKSFCELFHGTNMLTLGVGAEKNQIASDAVCLKKK